MVYISSFFFFQLMLFFTAEIKRDDDTFCFKQIPKQINLLHEFGHVENLSWNSGWGKREGIKERSNLFS